ncbi:Uncharacterised protein [uncultured archaeon]|nr:Uncharacterised protein [uncultured archaeon]
MSKTLLIGICGKAENGKTAAARIIREWTIGQGGTAGIFEISGLILEHCYKLGLIPQGTTREQCTEAQVKILVDEGSRMRNEVGPQYWTNLIVPKMQASGLDVAICPNLRFPQEAQAVRAAGGYVWRVNRLNTDGSPFVSTTRDPNHECETALDRWPADFYLYNMTGHGALLEELVVTLFSYVEALHRNQ